MAPPKRRFTSDDEKSHLPRQDNPPPTTRENEQASGGAASQNYVDDGNDYYKYLACDEQCHHHSINSSPAQTAGTNSPSTTGANAPEWPPRDDEEYGEEESYNPPSVAENMITDDCAQGCNEHNPSNSREPTAFSPPPKRRMITPFRGWETSKPSPFATGGGFESFQSTQPTPNLPAQSVPQQQSLQNIPERYSFSAAAHQFASPSTMTPRMMTGRQSSSMEDDGRPLASPDVPSRMMSAPTRDTSMIPSEFNPQDLLDLQRPWPYRHGFMGGAPQATTSSNDPVRIDIDETTNSSPPRNEYVSNNATGLRVTSSPMHPSIMCTDDVTQDLSHLYRSIRLDNPNNAYRRSASSSRNISTYMGTETVMNGPIRSNTQQYTAVQYGNLGTNDGSFSGQQSVIAQSRRFVRSRSQDQTASLAQLHRYQGSRFSSTSSEQSTIRITYSSSGVTFRAPQGASSPPIQPQIHNAGRYFGGTSAPDHLHPRLNASNTMQGLLDSINHMVDTITNAMHQGGPYGSPPGPSREN